MALVSANKIVEDAINIYNQQCGYIYGSHGEIWTQAKQTAVERDPKGRPQTKDWGGQWVGRQVFDCSGLWVYIMEQNGGYVNHSSNSIWESYCVQKGKLKNGKKENGEPLKLATAVFLTEGTDRHHIGIYIGNGKVIEAKGTYYGVVESNVTEWDEWGEIKNVKYEEITMQATKIKNIYVTSSWKPIYGILQKPNSIFLDITTDQSLEKSSQYIYNIERFIGSMFSNGSYITSASTTYDWVKSKNYTFSAIRTSNNSIRILIQPKSGNFKKDGTSKDVIKYFPVIFLGQITIGLYKINGEA